MGDDLKFTLKKKDLQKFLKIEYVILAFFIIAAAFYVNFDKLPLTHPGNLKASDTFVHSLSVEKVIDTKQWDFDDLYITAGIYNMSTIQPPLYYTNAAILTMFSKVPAWATFYLVVCLSQAFFVLLMYLITKEIFNNEKISIISAGLTILPLPVTIWLYPVYIGIWIQVCGYSLMMFYFWLFLRYLNKKETWALLFMGVSICSLILTHTADIFLLFIPSLAIGFTLLLDFLKKRDIYEFIKRALIFGILPLLVILLLLPKFLFVWRGYAGEGNAYLPGFYKPVISIFDSSNPVSQMVFPGYENIPLWQVIIAFLGIIVVILMKFYPYSFSIQVKNEVKLIGKKTNPYSLNWLYLALYFFIFVYFCEYFIYKPYYIGRMRALQPYMIYPFLAFGIYLILSFVLSFVFAVSKSSQKNKTSNEEYNKKLDIFSYAAIFAFIIFVIYSTVPAYLNQVNSLRYEHVTISQWDAYEFIKKNSDMSDKVLFFGSHDQSEGQYVKRVTGIFAHDAFQKYLQVISDNNVPLEFEISGWGGTTPSSNIIKLGTWKYKRVPDPNTNVSIYDFEYVFFMDEKPGIKEMNDFFIYKFSQVGFNLVYNKNGYRVLRNERNN